MKKYYFDDPEGDALSRDTCHPNFVKHLSAGFYYDCTDDFSPFGNDDGADLLYNLEDWYREKKGKGNIVKWLFHTIDEMGFVYQSEGCSNLLDLPTLKQLEAEDPGYLNCMDNTIIAAAFRQYKITGEIDREMKELAQTAIGRQCLLNEQDGNNMAKGYQVYLDTLMEDLRRSETPYRSSPSQDKRASTPGKNWHHYSIVYILSIRRHDQPRFPHHCCPSPRRLFRR